MSDKDFEEYAMNCKNCEYLSHFPCETYRSSSSGTVYSRYNCLKYNFIFNDSNVPLQRPCTCFSPTIWCMIKCYIKNFFRKIYTLEKNRIMKLKWLIYPLRIFYVLLIVVGMCTIPVLTVVMLLTPILDIFCYIATGRLRVLESFCEWYFGKYPDYYLDYLKPENILERIENRHKK